MKLKVCYYGNPILRKKTEVITEITPEICQLAQEMMGSLDELNAIGLAANQVGSSHRLFVLRRYIHLPEGKWTVSEPYAYLNPKILDHSKETWIDEEGCISIPKIKLPVERPLKIKVESMRLDGSTVVEELEGINARVVLHENDHLNGVLYIDRVEEKYLKSVESQLREIKKNLA
jgi:peptide deformylase